MKPRSPGYSFVLDSMDHTLATQLRNYAVNNTEDREGGVFKTVKEWFSLIGVQYICAHANILCPVTDNYRFLNGTLHSPPLDTDFLYSKRWMHQSCLQPSTAEFRDDGMEEAQSGAEFVSAEKAQASAELLPAVPVVMEVSQGLVNAVRASLPGYDTVNVPGKKCCALYPWCCVNR